MNIEDIRQEYNQLNTQLKNALSTMEFSDQVRIVRNEMRQLQELCPHNNGKYDFSKESVCPYCGKVFQNQE